MGWCRARPKRPAGGRSCCACTREAPPGPTRVHRMKWVVTGAAGMLRVDVVEVLRSSGHSVRPLTRADLDVRDPAACRSAVEGAEAVVNAAAWTDVDGAETQERAAFAVNAVGA